MKARPAQPAPTPTLRIFYDGGCKVCAWEVGKYLEADQAGRLGLIDINVPEFDAALYGLDRLAVRKYFHVLTREGKVLAGVDAFIEIWRTLDTPFSRRATWLARLAPIHALLSAGYVGFVAIRPYLPRNEPGRPGCEDNSCAISESNTPKGTPK